MATLAGTTIANTYDSLLHVEDNTAGLVATSTDSRVIQDGVGANSALALATDSVRITSTNKLYFNDVGGEYISGNGSILSIVGGNEIDLTATAIDINGTVDMSSTVMFNGVPTVSASGGAVMKLHRDASDIQDGNDIGQIEFTGADPSSVHSGAMIRGEAAGEWTTDNENKPTELQFFTQDAGDGDGMASPNMVIDKDGNVGIGTAAPASQISGTILHVADTGGSNPAVINLTGGAGGNGNTTGEIQFSDPGNTDEIVASIVGNITGTNATPGGDILFYTQPDGGSVAERMRIDSAGFVGIGHSDPKKMLHIRKNDTDCMIILDAQDSIADKQICFAEDYGSGSTSDGQYWSVGVDASEGPDFVIAYDQNSQPSMGGDDDKLRIKTTGLVVLNQGANDGSILEFRSSDVAHGMTDNYPTNVYGAFSKASALGGGLRLEGYSEGKNGILLDGISDSDNTAKTTSAAGNVSIRAWKKSSNSWDTIESDGNLLTVGNGNAVRFIFDEDGDFHYDSSAVAYDSYNDAQLVRAFDSTMSPKNIIQSKWDEFVTYKEKDLVEANLLGKVSDEEKAEGVRPLVSLTGMSRLHNGAIWQQYTEMQKMKELMYDAMVELMGKEKADKKLKNHDVSLLDNKDSLN